MSSTALALFKRGNLFLAVCVLQTMDTLDTDKANLARLNRIIFNK